MRVVSGTCVLTLALVLGSPVQAFQTAPTPEQYIKALTAADAQPPVAPAVDVTEDVSDAAEAAPDPYDLDMNQHVAEKGGVLAFSVGGGKANKAGKSPPTNPVTSTKPARTYAANTRPTRPISPPPAAPVSVNMAIHFVSGSATLTVEDRRNAQAFAQAANSAELKNKSFLIGGHTDAKGSRDINQKLSWQRAEAVKSYLVAQGVSASRLKTYGFGYDRPVPGTDALNDANRRVEVSLTAS